VDLLQEIWHWNFSKRLIIKIIYELYFLSSLSRAPRILLCRKKPNRGGLPLCRIFINLSKSDDIDPESAIFRGN
jgi:hypothetical protein